MAGFFMLYQKYVKKNSGDLPFCPTQLYYLINSRHARRYFQTTRKKIYQQ